MLRISNTNVRKRCLKKGVQVIKQTTVMLLASTVHNFESIRKFKKPTKFSFVKMIVVDNLKGKTFGEKVSEISNIILFCTEIDEQIFYLPQNVSPKEVGNLLPLVLLMISNAKCTMLGIHHISTKYSQNYPDELCYTVNRRNFGDHLFDRLLIVSLLKIIKGY